MSFEDNAVRTAHRGYFLLKVEKKHDNVYDWKKKLFWLASKKQYKIYNNIRKITTGQRDD